MQVQTRPPGFFLCTQDAGLENMALEVGTLQGGQIAALQGGSKEVADGKQAPSGLLIFMLCCCGVSRKSQYLLEILRMSCT